MTGTKGEYAWVPDERTVRACIEALPGLRVNGGIYGLSGYALQEEVASHYRQRVVSALKSLLPRDPAKELVEEFASDTSDAGASAWLGPDANMQEDKGWLVEHFARWLIESGRVK